MVRPTALLFEVKVRKINERSNDEGHETKPIDFDRVDEETYDCEKPA